MKLTGNKILITGGASGIGLGLAERFMQEGNTVIICGRRQAMLDAVQAKYPGAITKMCDLSESADCEKLFEWLEKEHSDLNVLVNNAGIQQWMSVRDENFMLRAKDEITINIEVPLRLTSLFLKMKNAAAVLNVTSGLSFVPLAKVPVYSATKAFFHSWTLSLRYLLKPDGIEVIELVPPALNTDLGGKGLHDAAPPVGDFIKSAFEQLKEGKDTVTFGFSEAMINAGPAELNAAFGRMNP